MKLSLVFEFLGNIPQIISCLILNTFSTAFSPHEEDDDDDHDHEEEENLILPEVWIKRI